MAETIDDSRLPQLEHLGDATQFAGKLPVEWSVLDVDARSEGGATFDRQDDGSLLVTGTIPDNDTYTLTAPLPERPVAARAILTAFSTASTPVVSSNVFLRASPGASALRRSASRT